MAVNPPYERGTGPWKRDPSMPAPPCIVNPEPTTARGHRRSNNTAEYQENCRDREQQAHPATPTKNRGNPKLPPRGPSKRPKGLSQEAWRNYMTGRSDTLA